MDNCRICLHYRKNMCSIFEKADKITYCAMITSIADVKIRNEDEITDRLCSSCRKKLIDAYNFKLCIERSDMELQETANLKRISFNNLNDSLEIDIDCKPHIPQLEYMSNKLLKDGSDCITYNNTVIKKIENLSDDENITKSLPVVDSIKTECDDSDYDYVVQDDNYPSDSESDYSYDKKLSLRKKQKYCNKSDDRKKQTKSFEQPQGKRIKLKYRLDLIAGRSDCNKRKHSVQTHICPYCGKLLKTAKSLDTHILSHTGEKSFKCDQCPKAFYKEYVLRKHKKTHSQKRDIKCDQCIATFPDKLSLKSHMIKHTDEKNFVCDICNKAFKRKYVLVLHKRTHNFGSKPVQCELCPLTFNTKWNMQHHMRVHTGERPYKCEICSQPYSYKHDFNRHCLNKHGIFLKRRSVYVMNEEVLQRERALMKELALRAHGIIKDGDIENQFDGPKGALAYDEVLKAIEANKIPISF